MSSMRSKPQKRYKSDNKDSVKMLRQKRRNILESIHETMEEDDISKATRNNKLGLDRLCTMKRTSHNESNVLLAKMLEDLHKNQSKGKAFEQKTQDSR